MVGGVAFFAILVIVWYVFYAKPAMAPSLGGTNNPLPTRTFPARFQFLNWGQDEVSSSTTEFTDPLKMPLVRVWNKPATGQTFITEEILKEILATTTQGTTTIEVKRQVRATTTVLIFVDKITGYIYGYPLETGAIYQISNTIIPGAADAYFFDNGKRVIIRNFDYEKNTVTAVIAKVPNVKPDGSALPLEEMTYLPSKVTAIATNKRGDRASYIVTTDRGSTIYTTTSLGTSPVASSPFGEWDLSYGGETLYTTTKPSAYVIGVTTKLPSFLIQNGERTGLMSNPSGGGEILSSMWSSKGLLMFLSSFGKDTVLPIKTLASKCSWGTQDFLVCALPRSIPKADEGMPDDWFQGKVTFNDDLYVIDKETGNQYPMYTFSDKEGLYDIINITLNGTNEILSFNRKQDDSLWMLNTNLLIRE